LELRDSPAHCLKRQGTASTRPVVALGAVTVVALGAVTVVGVRSFVRSFRGGAQRGGPRLARGRVSAVGEGSVGGTRGGEQTGKIV
jgi:hypothetical protein